MPRNPNRLVVGPKHSRLPAQVVQDQQRMQPRTPLPPSKKRAPIAPVSIVDAFYQMLPTPDLQQQSISGEMKFGMTDIINAGQNGLSMREIVTRDQQVYIWTNVTFYALQPGDGMAGAPRQMSTHQLSGLLRFNVQIDNLSPMNLICEPMNPNQPTAGSKNGFKAGWTTLDRDFGATRYGSAFALYARSLQRTKVTVSLQYLNPPLSPRFVIDRLGFELHGYVASEGDFDMVWRRTVGG